MPKKNLELTAALKVLHKKLKRSIKETALHVQSQKKKYSRELAQFEAECINYQRGGK
jgi:hypothetical protein